MKIRCIGEHNRNDSILYAENLIGAFTRGHRQKKYKSKCLTRYDGFNFGRVNSLSI